MTYGFGKTYTIPAKFTALNGCIQYYKLTAEKPLAVEPVKNEKGEITNAREMAEAEANLLRVLEVLRTYGGQPVITVVTGNSVEFTLEQANVFGEAGQKQVSKRDMITDAIKAIEDLFANVRPVVVTLDDEGKFVFTSAEDEEKDVEGVKTMVAPKLVVVGNVEVRAAF